jgi:peroxiredoxin
MVLVGCLAITLAASLPAAGKLQTTIANLKFSGTLSDADRQYLGLEKPGPFTLKDINAPYVLIELMRTTCPHCIAQAPAMNRLSHLVANSPLKDKVKLISVGQTDDASALKQFKAAHKVPFPLVPDSGCEIGTAFHIAGTPTTVLVNKHGTVLWVEEGSFVNAEQVLQKIKAKVK